MQRQTYIAILIHVHAGSGVLVSFWVCACMCHRYGAHCSESKALIGGGECASSYGRLSNAACSHSSGWSLCAGLGPPLVLYFKGRVGLHGTKEDANLPIAADGGGKT